MTKHPPNKIAFILLVLHRNATPACIITSLSFKRLSIMLYTDRSPLSIYNNYYTVPIDHVKGHSVLKLTWYIARIMGSLMND